jgi:hypothetical protein
MLEQALSAYKENRQRRATCGSGNISVDCAPFLGRKSMRVSFAATVLAAALTAAASAAEAPTTAPTPRPNFAIVRGTVQSFDGKILSIRTTAGTTVAAPVGPNMRYAAVEARTFEQLKPTDFVGITSVDGPNGHLVAEEIHILPGVMGEGQYPWDHHPEGNSQGPTRAGSMTNGTVQPLSSQGGMRMGSMTNGTVSTGGNHQLTVTFHGSQIVDGKCVGRAPPAGTTGCVGTAIADVTPKTFIQAVIPAKADDVKPGLAVVAFGLTAPDGSVAAFGSATVEKNGVKPEM